MKFRFLAKAIAEFEDAVDWYDKQKFGLGREFAEAVISAIQRIQSDPESHPTCGDPYRYCPTARFPYIVIYRFDEVIHITAVAHTSRESGYWLARTRDT